MCGIFGYISSATSSASSSTNSTKITPQMLYEAFEKIRVRGPDRSTFHEISEYGQTLYLGFQRLAIIDTSTYGDQPFTLEYKRYDNDTGELIAHRSIYVICNGEIYNHHELTALYNYTDLLRGRSDCEFLSHFYAEHGIEKFCEDLRGEFAVGILDINRLTKSMVLHLVRDALSVRPLFVGHDERGFGFASEMKSLTSIVDQTSIHQLRGGHRMSVVIRADGFVFNETCYFDLRKYEKPVTDLDEGYTYEVTDMLQRMYPDLNAEQRLVELESILRRVRETFERVVVSTMEADVPMGALLSGGLDSSLTSSIMAKELRKYGKQLRTFSVGLPGAVDKNYAIAVSEHICSLHTHIEFEPDAFLAAIPDVIQAIESYDITTTRASVGQFIVCKWIRENTDIKVLVQGDYSDEGMGSYLYFFNSKSPITSHNETIRLLRDIGYFDALRSDRGIANNSIEARTPFAHKDFVELIMQTDPRLKVPLSDTGLIDSRCPKRREKWLLRKAFDTMYTDVDGIAKAYLPQKVLWRVKDGFSDSCSSKEKPWYQEIQESVEDKYNQIDIDRWVSILAEADTQCRPLTKEAVHYLELFTQYYGHAFQVIPYYWMPKWSGDVSNPSGRIMSAYE